MSDSLYELERAVYYALATHGSLNSDAWREFNLSEKMLRCMMTHTLSETANRMNTAVRTWKRSFIQK